MKVQELVDRSVASLVSDAHHTVPRASHQPSLMKPITLIDLPFAVGRWPTKTWIVRVRS